METKVATAPLGANKLDMSELKNTDIVYFCRNSGSEELRYSLRSVAKNFPHRKVWIYGEKPADINPDEFIGITQDENVDTKYYRVGNLIKLACANPEITENFVLFNDDFFVLKSISELEPMYRYSLFEQIVRMEYAFKNEPSPYTIILRDTCMTLSRLDLPCQSYEVHVPMMFNRTKLTELFEKFPRRLCLRSLYGNFYQIGGKKIQDVKVYPGKEEFDRDSTYLSSDERIFHPGNDFTDFIMSLFPEKSPYEL